MKTLAAIAIWSMLCINDTPLEEILCESVVVLLLESFPLHDVLHMV